MTGISVNEAPGVAVPNVPVPGLEQEKAHERLGKLPRFYDALLDSENIESILKDIAEDEKAMTIFLETLDMTALHLILNSLVPNTSADYDEAELHEKTAIATEFAQKLESDDYLMELENKKLGITQALRELLNTTLSKILSDSA